MKSGVDISPQHSVLNNNDTSTGLLRKKMQHLTIVVAKGRQESILRLFISVVLLTLVTALLLSNSSCEEVRLTYTIDHHAGGNNDGIGIDGRKASLNPLSLAEHKGDIYISDKFNNLIVKVDKNNTYYKVAGTGKMGSGESIAEGPALQVPLCEPKGLIFNPEGELYFADCTHRIRKILLNGTIVVVAGSGVVGRHSENVPALETNMYYPTSVAFSPTGELYYADSSNLVIRKIGHDGNVTTVVGGGTKNVGYDETIPATTFVLGYVNSIYFDNDGDLYIVQGYIFKYSLKDGTVSIKKLTYPSDNYIGLEFVSKGIDGNYYAADSTYQIFKFGSDGVIKRIAGMENNYGEGEDNVDALLIGLRKPKSVIYYNSTGTPYVLIADTDFNKVRRIDKKGMISTIVGDGTLNAFNGDGLPLNLIKTASPTTLKINPLNNYIYFGDGKKLRHLTNSTVVTESNTYCSISGIGFGVNDKNLPIFVTDECGNKIYRVVDGNAGDYSRSYTLHSPMGAVVVEPPYPNNAIVYSAVKGDNYVEGFSYNNIRIAGINKDYYGFNQDGLKGTNTYLNCPSDVVMTQKNEFLISDTCNNRIRKVDVNLIVSTICGNGQANYTGDGGLASQATINAPTNMIYTKSGMLIFYDAGNNVIRMIKDNIITTIAGTGQIGYSGNGGPALLASFNNIRGMDIANDGIIYISDNGNSVIRKLIPSCAANYLLSSDGTTCLSTCYGLLSNNSKVCSGHGECIDNNECECSSGYIGDMCNIFGCYSRAGNDTTSCSGRGKCISANNCTCDFPYFGEECQYCKCFNIRSDNVTVCSGHGNCIDQNNCSCTGGYFGDQCDQFKCGNFTPGQSGVCHKRGTCVGPNNCKCKDGYAGNDCQATACFGISGLNSSVCSGHGNCTGINNCFCNYGYGGQKCYDHKCFGSYHDSPSVCSSHGQCVGVDKCNCTEGYYAPDCSSYDCYGINVNDGACSLRGTCVAPDSCSCNDGIFGDTCDYWYCYGESILTSYIHPKSTWWIFIDGHP